MELGGVRWHWTVLLSSLLGGVCVGWSKVELGCIKCSEVGFGCSSY